MQVSLAPTQPFSKAGFQKGFNDDRGNLFFNIRNIVNLHKHKYIILENVKSLISNNSGNTWKIVLESLDELGYYTYQTPISVKRFTF